MDHETNIVKKKPQIGDEEFIRIVKDNFSVLSCLKQLNLVPAGGNYKFFHKRVKQLNLDTSHFTGKGHLKGKTHNWASEISVENAFVENGSLSSYGLNLKIRKYNLKEYKCSCCNLFEWNGKELSLHLDHINGINDDNRLDNLRFLCPNCHSQTDTYCGKNIKYIKPITRDECECGKQKSIKKDKCFACNNSADKLSIRKVIRPSKDELLDLLWTKSTLAIAKNYGVSDNAIKKWAKRYNLSFPPRGYWAKYHAGHLDECESIKNRMIH